MKLTRRCVSKSRLLPAVLLALSGCSDSKDEPAAMLDDSPAIPVEPPIDEPVVEPVQQPVDTPDNTSLPLINEQNHEALLKNVVKLMNAEKLEEQWRLAVVIFGERDEQLGGGSDELELADSGPDGLGSIFNRFTCAGGGTLKFLQPMEQPVDGGFFVATFASCVLSSGTYSGNHQRRFERFAVSDTFENYSVKTATSEFQLTGSRSTGDVFSRNRESRIWSSSSWRTESEAGVMSLADFQTIITSNINDGPSRTAVADFSVTAPWTQNKPVSVTTKSPFYNAQTTSLTRRYLTGSVEVHASDDSGMVLDADTGTVDTFAISLSAGGATQSFIHEWADDFDLSCVNPSLGSAVDGCESI